MLQFYHYAILYYVIINLTAFFVYGLDKRKAENDKWRIPESTLLFLALLGGGIGAFAGMHIWHHKTKKPKFKILVPAYLVLHIILILFLTYQNNHLVVTEYDMDADLDIRIVQVSDLHNTKLWWNRNYLANRVRELNPDIIVITGDIVDRRHTDVEGALYTAGELAKIADTYYVSGNHEKWLDETKREQLYSGLNESGVRILSDEYTVMSEASIPYVLIGLDDGHLVNGTLQTVMEELTESEYSGLPTILLAHEPQYIDYYSECKVDYVFCGHAHGGQWNLPLLGPLVAPDQGFLPEYASGVFHKEGTTMIVSRGIGNSLCPFRLFNYPEIVVAE